MTSGADFHSVKKHRFLTSGADFHSVKKHRFLTSGAGFYFFQFFAFPKNIGNIGNIVNIGNIGNIGTSKTSATSGTSGAADQNIGALSQKKGDSRDFRWRHDVIRTSEVVGNAAVRRFVLSTTRSKMNLEVAF